MYFVMNVGEYPRVASFREYILRHHAKKAEQVWTKLFTDTPHALEWTQAALNYPRSQIYSWETFSGYP